MSIDIWRCAGFWNKNIRPLEGYFLTKTAEPYSVKVTQDILRQKAPPISIPYFLLRLTKRG